MLGRKNYTQEELTGATTAVDRQLAAYTKLAKAVQETSDPKAIATLEAFEPLLFNNMALVLDRYFVHRIRPVSGKDGNPLNEVELISESLISNGGVFRGNNVIKMISAESVLKLEPGEEIRLSQADFQRLYKAFLAELQSRFLQEAA